MLLELTVRNFAVIEETRLSLGPGLNVITGETGAGKSLLVDALEIVLGGRAARDAVRAGTQSSMVEAVFQLPPEHPLWEFLEREHGLAREDDCLLVLARETHREGRSLCRLNGGTVPLSVVRDVGQLLVDIHGQGTHLSLLNPAFQLQLLDSYAGLDGSRAQVAEAVAEIKRLDRELLALNTDARQAEQSHDFLTFQVAEIDAAQLQHGEEESLVQERQLLAGARAIHEACAAARDALYDGASNAADLIAVARQALNHAPDPTGALRQHIAALEAAAVQVQEVSRAVRTHAESVDDDPARQEAVEERLETIRLLKRKYGDTVEAVLVFAERAGRELQAMEHSDRSRVVIEQALADAYSRAGDMAWQLSEDRRQAAVRLAKAVTIHLEELRLGRARFETTLLKHQTPDGLPGPDGHSYVFTQAGIDQAEFLVATNPGEGTKPLAKVASGGETSRLMLAITGALAAQSQVSTLVFDEIDSGIGGRTADTVGRKLWSLARHNQVLCATHLPQIAAFADQHFLVDKEVLQGRTFARAALLGEEDQIRELASMLGGTPGPHLHGTAQQLLGQAHAHKRGASGPSAPHSIRKNQ